GAMALQNDVLIIAIIKRFLNLRYLEIGHNDIGDENRCIQIAKDILKDEPIIEYRHPFLNRLEFDAFFQKYRIALEVQGAQHQFYSTSWSDNGIFLLEVWYDEKPEIVIPERIRKIKEF
ncbi:5978_t:CDS:2, partial [Funneliformis geosporum]